MSASKGPSAGCVIIPNETKSAHSNRLEIRVSAPYELVMRSCDARAMVVNGTVADRLFTPPTKNVPRGDLESGTKDLGSNEFCHDDDEESVFAALAARVGMF